MATRVTEDDGSQWIDAETFNDVLAALKVARERLAALLEDRATSMDYDVSRDRTVFQIDAAIAKAEAQT